MEGGGGRSLATILPAAQILREAEPEETSIFLNATTGLFFPSCHLHLPPHAALGVAGAHRLLRWQRRSFQLQTFVVNSLVMVVLGVIFFLVTISTSFNYNTNILSPLWFNTSVLLLVLSFFISLFLAAELSSSRADFAVSSRTLFQPSFPESGWKTGVSVALLLLLLVPPLLAVCLHLTSSTEQPYVVLLERRGEGEARVTVLAALAAPVPLPAPTLHLLPYRDCHLPLLPPLTLTGHFILLNSSTLACRY